MTHGTRTCYQAGCHAPCCRAANAAYMAARRRQSSPPLGVYVSASEASRHLRALVREHYSKRTLARLGGLERHTLTLTAAQVVRFKTVLKLRRLCRILLSE